MDGDLSFDSRWQQRSSSRFQICECRETAKPKSRKNKIAHAGSRHPPRNLVKQQVIELWYSRALLRIWHIAYGIHIFWPIPFSLSHMNNAHEYINLLPSLHAFCFAPEFIHFFFPLPQGPICFASCDPKQSRSLCDPFCLFGNFL